VDTGLAGKTALITAGATGIGFGIARALANEKVNLAIASLDLDERNVADLRAAGVRVETFFCDVSHEDEVVALVEKVTAAFGRIDLYVNNAAWHWHQPVTAVDTESLMNTLQTNLFACIWACRQVAKQMISRRSGSILIVGSTAMLNPFYGETSYRISKASLAYYAEVLAIELAPYGIRVNTIIPGFFVTKLSSSGMSEAALQRLLAEIPLRRAGTPPDIGGQAVLLLSDRLSGYTTGATALVDGGLHLRPLPFLSEQELLDLNSSHRT
jgi:NAD(P)-dependent dehydrogenase (short-subunit alcohol dehydrogenase family)